MLIRAIALAGGLAGAATMSQFPEYSQQYVQRLGGAVDALGRVVAEFDADAAAVGFSRSEALVDLAGGGRMASARAQTMAVTITRHARLRADLAALDMAGPFTRAAQLGRFADRRIAAAAFENFRPAVPLTFEGAVFAGAGLVGGLALVSLLMALLRWPLRHLRRRRTA